MNSQIKSEIWDSNRIRFHTSMSDNMDCSQQGNLNSPQSMEEEIYVELNNDQRIVKLHN